MTIKKVTYILLTYILLNSCGIYWVSTETRDQIVWKRRLRINKKTNNLSYTSTKDNCYPIPTKKNRSGESGDYNYYEFDSIHILIPKKDSVLINLIENGLITGLHFFSPPRPSYCNLLTWTSPVKTQSDGWYGYDIVIQQAKELKITRAPKKEDLYKVFSFSFYYHGQPFVNPSIFRIHITNKKYKFNQHSISFDKFLDGAIVTEFFQIGVE